MKKDTFEPMYPKLHGHPVKDNPKVRFPLLAVRMLDVSSILLYAVPGFLGSAFDEFSAVAVLLSSLRHDYHTVL